jgi:hypothetical protein
MYALSIDRGFKEKRREEEKLFSEKRESGTRWFGQEGVVEQLVPRCSEPSSILQNRKGAVYTLGE